MSSDHRRRQVAKGSISRSRERPPDRKQERGPAGDRTADLKGNSTSNGTHGHGKHIPCTRMQHIVGI